MEEDLDSIKWEDHKTFFDLDIQKVIQETHSKNGKPFDLRTSQEVALHVLGAKKNLFMIVGTGVGKTICYTYGIDILRLKMGIPNGVALVTAPLTIILTQKMGECPEDMVILTMAGQIKGRQSEDLDISGHLEDKIYAGHFKIIIGHPESWATETGQRVLLGLKRRKMAILYAIDEFHKMLPAHWKKIRPEMADMSRRLRAFLVKGSPTVCLSATVTKEEIAATIELLGFSEPAVVLSSSPIQSQFKVVVLKSPPSSAPPDGYTDAKGIYHPGFLNLFCRIYGDELVQKVKQGRAAELRRLVMFFRTDSQLIAVFNYLREQLGVRDARTAPFVMFTSSTQGQTSLVIGARAHEVPAILTTQCLEMGMNLPKEDIVIFSRPPDTGHSIVQGMGRTGRPLANCPGFRRKSLVYILYNNYDINTSKDMNNVVKELCTEESKCLKDILAEYFVGDSSIIKKHLTWCCSNCDKIGVEEVDLLQEMGQEDES